MAGRRFLQAPRSADPVGCQPADFLGDVRRHGREAVVVVRLDAHHARLLRRSEADREPHPERDRHLSEDITQASFPDDALSPRRA